MFDERRDRRPASASRRQALRSTCRRRSYASHIQWSTSGHKRSWIRSIVGRVGGTRGLRCRESIQSPPRRVRKTSTRRLRGRYPGCNSLRFRRSARCNLRDHCILHPKLGRRTSWSLRIVRSCHIASRTGTFRKIHRIRLSHMFEVHSSACMSTRTARSSCRRSRTMHRRFRTSLRSHRAHTIGRRKRESRSVPRRIRRRSLSLMRTNHKAHRTVRIRRSHRRIQARRLRGWDDSGRPKLCSTSRLGTQ